MFVRHQRQRSTAFLKEREVSGKRALLGARSGRLGGMWSGSLRSLGMALLLIAACGGTPRRLDKKGPPPPPLSQAAYAHYLRGQIATFEGDFARAIPELRQATRVAPGEALIAIALISAIYESGDPEMAMSELARAQAQWPDSPQVWIKGGAIHRGLGEHKLAVRSYGKAIAQGARTSAVLLAYAGELSAMGDRKAAEKQYRKIVATRADAAEARYQLALLLHLRGDSKKALPHLARVVELSPYDLRAWALWSTALRLAGKPDRARDALRRPFDRSGGDVGIAEQLLVQLLALGRRQDAAELITILDRDDLVLDTRIGMGHLQLRLGEFEAALKTSQGLDKGLPSSAAIAELRARALRALHRDEEAAAQLLAIAEGEPGHALTRAMLGELLADAGKFSEAREVLKKAQAVHAEDADLILAQASVAEKSGQIDEAREILRGALVRHPTARRPLYALAELESRNDRVDEAIRLISPLVAANPRDSSALNYLGYSLIQKPGSQARARRLLLRALELSPESAFILDSYGWLLVSTGELDAAAPYLQRAARLTPAEPEVLYHLAELRWRQGARREASRLFARAEDLALSPHLKKRIQSRRRDR